MVRSEMVGNVVGDGIGVRGQGQGHVHGQQRAAQSCVSIAGGFALVSVPGLMACWRACRSKPLRIGDFRAWLACHELKARRCRLPEGCPATYSVAELAGLLDVTERTARASIRRLVKSGHLEWSGFAIGFPGPSGEGIEDSEALDAIGHGRGVLVLPRRIIRFLARGSRPALIATTLGVLLRCLSRRRAGFDGRGRLKVSWVARIFHVGIRQAKAARCELQELGWIDCEASDQWSMNRWGRAYRVNLAWSQPAAGGGASLTPPGRQSGASLTPPDLQTPIPSGRKNNQEPGESVRGTGVGLKDRGMERKNQPEATQVGGSSRPASPGLPPGPIRSPATRPQSAHPDPEAAGTKPVSSLPSPSHTTLPTLAPPTLADVRPEDLADTGRTLQLLDQANGRGLVGSSEHDRLRFLSLAEHARSVGKENPGGLFASLLRRGAWNFVTHEEEDRARRKLRAHELGGQPSPANGQALTLPTRASTSGAAPHLGGSSSLADVLARLKYPAPGS